MLFETSRLNRLPLSSLGTQSIYSEVKLNQNFRSVVHSKIFKRSNIQAFKSFHILITGHDRTVAPHSVSLAFVSTNQQASIH